MSKFKEIVHKFRYNIYFFVATTHRHQNHHDHRRRADCDWPGL